MQVEVKMAVDVVQGETRGPEFFELGPDFALQLRAEAWPKKVAEARDNRVVAEVSCGIDQTWDFTGRQGRCGANQTEVQADAKARILSGQFDGFIGLRAVDHQAGRGEDAFAVRVDDGVVDGTGASEVVGVDDEPAQGTHAEFGAWLFIAIRIFHPHGRYRTVTKNFQCIENSLSQY